MDPATRPAFAALLRTFRVARGLSQEALARQAGLSLDAISLLERGLRLAPRQDTVRLLARTLQLSADERERLSAAAAQGRRLGTRASHALPGRPAPLPPRLSSFVGRQREMGEVRDLVLGKRLVTLTGPGGIGKSSLALAVAAHVQAQFADGAMLAELAPLADGALVAPAVAAAVGVRDQPGEPIIATLGRVLATGRRLLVLDNCEHLLQRCAEVAETLLGACPGLTILATSREPLRVAAEAIWRVPALSLPEGDTGSLEELQRSEAVSLFVERAEGVCAGFALSRRNAAAVAEICRRLDGIPLALELAAARMAALSPEQLVRHLDDRFRLLTTGSRVALPRHRTLRAMLDWSYELLAPPERALFRRLAAFAGGFTLEAATAVCADRADVAQVPVAGGTRPAAVLPEREALGVLLGLVDKSLVQVEARDAEARYLLLETLRAYARDKLDDSGETEAVRAAHAAYFAAWVGGSGPQPVTNVIELLATPAGATAYGPAAEMDNLRTALGWFLDRGDAEAGLGLAVRIYRVWFCLGPQEEGRAWLRRFLALPAAAAAPSRAAALYAAGWLAQFQGDLAEAHAAYAEALALALARGDRRGQAYAQNALAMVAVLQGAPARAELEAGIRLAREADAPVALLSGLANLGSLAIARGDLAGARAALTEGRAALPRFPALRFRFHWLAGELALAAGRGERAAREYRAGLAVVSAHGDPMGVAASALGLAEVAAAAGEGARAARLLGGSEGIGLGVGGRPFLQPMHRAQHARVEAAARALLGEDAFAALRAEGRRLGMEKVVRLALGDVDNR